MNQDNSARVALFSLPLAAIGSLLITSMLSRLAARILPKSETYARRRHELLGSVGEALYDIDQKFGMASIRDDRGNLFQVGCRSEQTEGAIHKGSRVKLVGYSARERLFYVVPVS
jgi:membrane protein implicated in regulation of membrane protease activity